MARKTQSGEFSKKLYWIEYKSPHGERSFKEIIGPYNSKPTFLLNSRYKGGNLITFNLNEEGNYIREI